MAALLATLGLGGTCDNQDISGQFALQVEETSAALQSYEQPYVGRMSLDFGLRNTSSADASFAISVQAQTSGEPDADACEEAASLPRERVLAAVDGEDQLVEGESAEVLRVRNRLQRFEVPDAGRGAFDLRIISESTYRLYFDDPDVQVRVFQGDDPIEPTATDVELTSCSATLATAQSFVLVEGTFRVVVETTQASVQVFVEEACAATRTVPRTCPGAASEVFVRDALELDAGGFLSGRIDSLDLGIGDRAVVSLECEGPGCAGEMELFFLVEQLECRSNNDCRGSDTCSTDGYCVDSGGACAQGGTSPPAALIVALLLAFVSRPRSRSRTRRASAGAFVALLVLIASVGAEAAEPRRHVFVQPSVVSHRFTGEVGRFASSGIGIQATQGVQVGWAGAYLTIGADYYLTNQPPPPYTRGLQTVLIATGARFALPLERVRPIFSVEYASLGVSSNALNRFTGNALHYNGVGAGAALRFESLLPLYVEAQATGRVFPAMREPTVQWGLGLAVGVAGFF